MRFYFAEETGDIYELKTEANIFPEKIYVPAGLTQLFHDEDEISPNNDPTYIDFHNTKTLTDAEGDNKYRMAFVNGEWELQEKEGWEYGG